MKVNKLDENSNRFRRLRRALFGDETGKIKTFAILSPENPMGIEATSVENRQSLDELKKALRILGLTYTPIRGSYGNKENSFAIFNCSLEDAKKLAGTYRQESFFWGRTSTDSNSKIGYYKTENEGVTYSLVEISDVITYEDEATDFFSKFGIKFRINMREFGDDVPEIENQGEFEESLNEKRTFMSRASHRRNAYGGK
jgi:hypothetical protein